MNYVKLFEEFVGEGVYDPGILKAFFMAGGPGSGKSHVATEIFDFPKLKMPEVFANAILCQHATARFRKNCETNICDNDFPTPCKHVCCECAFRSFLMRFKCPPC